MVGAASLQWYRPLVTLGGIALVAAMTLGFYTAALANHGSDVEMGCSRSSLAGHDLGLDTNGRSRNLKAPAGT